MAKFRIDPASLASIQAKIQAAGERKMQKLTLALQGWGLDVVTAIGREIEAIKAIDQGLLHAATYAENVIRSGPILSITIRNPIEYSVIVEFGRLPGGAPPPLLPIIGWAVRHGIATTLPVNVAFADYPKQFAASAAIVRNMGAGGGGKTGKQKEMDPITLDLVKVRLIARKIAELGVQGRHPFTIAWESKAATFKQDISRMVQ